RLQHARVPAGPWAALWRLRFWIWTSVVILFVGVLSYINLYTFFVRQQNDPSAWASYSTAETIAANEIVNHAAHDDIVLTAVFDRTPTLLFLAGNVTNIQRWTSTQPLPLIRYDHTRGAVMLFDETMLPTYYEAQRLYPGGKFTQWHAPAGGGPVLYEAVLTPHDLNAVQGIQAEYFSGDAASGEPVKRETLRRASVDWSEEPPLLAPFMARLSGTLQVPQYGEYGFDLRGGSGASLWIDEYPIGCQRILLASGTHSLRIDIPGTAQRLELLWQPRGAREFQPMPASALFHFPVTSSGLLGSYYPTPDWTGKPAFMQVDPRIAFYFHIVPLHRPYSVEWTGALFAPVTGTYTLGLYSVDGSWLKLDKQPLIANPAGHTEIDSIVFLSQGWHAINILFQDHTGGTRIYLYWTPPDSTKPELVPSRYLSPPMGHLPLSP
ncbi:MAG: PA14 domain-containing protein, partial [Bacteroidota bacterium]